MTGDKELLDYLHTNITMGLEALESLHKCLETTDNKIKGHVDKSLVTYKEFKKKCEIEIKSENSEVKKGNLLGVIMTKIGTRTEFMRDNSDSKIAETLIQGYNMGLIDITKKMKKYKSDVSKEILELAKEYKKMMEHGIKEIKEFL